VVEQELREGSYKQYGCVNYGPVDVDRAGPILPYSTLKDLALNSKAAIRGTITDIDQGFSFYGPSSLVEIQVDEWLKKKSDRIADQPFVYLVYPVAEFEAGGYRFCKTDARWGSKPQIGDEILFFPYRVAIDEARQVFLPDPDYYEVILYRKEKGALSLPRSLRNDPDVRGVKALEPLQKRALEALAVYDTSELGGNGDGVIDERDLVWPFLRMWVDDDFDGRSQKKEVRPLAFWKITGISLHYTQSRRVDGNMNVHELVGTYFKRLDGREGYFEIRPQRIEDIFFRDLPVPAP
jgi:hypothetical protein